jgi:hypothetical protein
MLGHGWRASAIFIFLFQLITSCGQSPEMEAGNRILEANLFLSSGKCTEALNTLNQVDSDKRDYYFYQTYSSAYACLADYKEIDFITQLSSINSAAFFKSLAAFATSIEVDPLSDGFTKLREAIRTIFYLSTDLGKQNSHRVTEYGSSKGEDLSIQALLQIIAYTGKFLYYFGNASSVGVKGGGAATNKCFIDYTTATAQTFHANNISSLGACNGVAKGHAELAASNSNKFARLCDFIVHLNHVFDILGNVTLPNDERFDSFTDVTTSLTTAKNQAISDLPAGTLTSLLSFYDYESCVTYASNASNLSNVELYFLAIVERGMQ